MNSKTLAAAAVILASSVGLAACGGSDLSTEDAHDTRNRCRQIEQVNDAGQTRPGNCLDDTQKRVIAFPNHFKNMATACDGYGHRLWETTSNHQMIAPDPSCPGYTPETAKAFPGIVQGGSQ